MDTIIVGGNNVNGTVSVHGADNLPLVELLGRSNESVIGLGQKNRPARITMYNTSQQPTINLSSADAKLTIGGNDANGSVSVLGVDGEPLVELLGRSTECVVGLGQKNRPGRISIYAGDKSESIRLDGGNGDIWIANADCAEDFDLDVPEVAPGTVLVLTDSGGLVPCSKYYDTKVAGIVSGAGSYKPGLVLDRVKATKNRVPIALIGKTFCLVDASAEPIHVGDLLTTAETPGHACRATDPQRAFGAIIGKALAPLSSGFGLIPLIVSLQ